MSNNDPIKEYNSAAFKLERLREKFEMSEEIEEPITDLHDCSNDLSDRGSRLEEFAHANFAEKIRKEANKYINSKSNKDDVWSQKYVKKSNTTSQYTSNILTYIIIIIIVIILIVNIFFTLTGKIFELVKYVVEEYIDDFDSQYNFNIESYNDNYIESTYEDEESDSYLYNSQKNLKEMEKLDFSVHSDKIEVNTIKTLDGKNFIRFYNDNEESFENLQIKLCFYDKNDNLITEDIVPIKVLFGKSEYYYETIELYEWERFTHEILSENVKYSNVTKEEIVLENNIGKQNNTLYNEYLSGEIKLSNKTNKRIISPIVRRLLFFCFLSGM